MEELQQVAGKNWNHVFRIKGFNVRGSNLPFDLFFSVYKGHGSGDAIWKSGLYY